MASVLQYSSISHSGFGPCNSSPTATNNDFWVHFSYIGAICSLLTWWIQCTLNGHVCAFSCVVTLEYFDQDTKPFCDVVKFAHILMPQNSSLAITGWPTSDTVWKDTMISNSAQVQSSDKCVVIVELCQIVTNLPLGLLLGSNHLEITWVERCLLLCLGSAGTTLLSDFGPTAACGLVLSRRCSVPFVNDALVC